MRNAALFCTLLAIIATWPFVTDPGGALLGHPGNDVWNHVWGYWWVAEELKAGRLPLQTDLMHFPETSRLFFIDSFGAVLTLPVQLLAGPVAAYNTACFFSFWTAGFGAWLLCRHVVGGLAGPGAETDRAALLGAAAYALAPHLMAQAYNGISETLNAAGLPLCTWAVLRLYERPNLRSAGVMAVVAGVSMLANWYFGLFAAMGAGLCLAGMAIWRRQRVHWQALPAPLALAGAGAAAIFGPVLIGFSSTLEGEGAMVTRDREFVWKQLISHNVTDIVTFFHPGKFYSPDLKARHGEDLLIVTYLGWVLIGLAALGVRRLPRWRDSAPWLLWIGFFTVMTLGPYLYVGGAHLLVQGRRIPLPFLAFFDALPMFERISHPFRFVMGSTLGLAVLGTAGLRSLPPQVARWGQPLALLAVVLEFLLASPAPWPLPRASAAIPPIYAQIAADPEPGAVLDLPALVPNLERAVYLYYQTQHGRPGPYALNEPMPEVLNRSHLIRALLVAEGGRIDRLPPMLGELDLIVAGRSLARLGFRYVVVHGALYPPSRLAMTLTLLRVSLGPETAQEGSSYLWLLENPSLTTTAATTGAAPAAEVEPGVESAPTRPPAPPTPDPPPTSPPPTEIPE